MLGPTVIFGVLVAIVLAIAAMRKVVARGDDEMLHVSDPTYAARETALAQRLDRIDFWGKLFTIITALYGIGLLVWYLYIGWQRGGSIE